MHKRLKNFIPGIAWFFVVLIVICIPGKNLPSANWLSSIYFDKWIHAGMFAVLTYMFCWPFFISEISYKSRKNIFIKIALAIIVWGLTTEFIQKFFISGRNFSLFDWLADSLGVLLAFWYCKKNIL